MSNLELNEKARSYFEILEAIAQLEAEAEAIKDEIKRELEMRETEELVCGQYIIRYANILTQRFDTTSFKKALPDVYKAFIKQSASRRFTITA